MRAEARPDLTGLALRHLNAANGGGVIDWQSRLPSGSPDAYNSALSGGANNFAPDRQQLWDEMQGVMESSPIYKALDTTISAMATVLRPIGHGIQATVSAINYVAKPALEVLTYMDRQILDIDIYSSMVQSIPGLDYLIAATQGAIEGKYAFMDGFLGIEAFFANAGMYDPNDSALGFSKGTGKWIGRVDMVVGGLGLTKGLLRGAAHSTSAYRARAAIGWTYDAAKSGIVSGAGRLRNLAETTRRTLKSAMPFRGSGDGFLRASSLKRGSIASAKVELPNKIGRNRAVTAFDRLKVSAGDVYHRAKVAYNYNVRHIFNRTIVLTQDTTFYTWKNSKYLDLDKNYKKLDLWLSPEKISDPAEAVRKLSLPFDSGYDLLLEVNLKAGDRILKPRKVWSLFNKPGGGVETRNISAVSKSQIRIHLESRG